jgi:hypothetical protein
MPDPTICAMSKMPVSKSVWRLNTCWPPRHEGTINSVPSETVKEQYLDKKLNERSIFQFIGPRDILLVGAGQLP